MELALRWIDDDGAHDGVLTTDLPDSCDSTIPVLLDRDGAFYSLDHLNDVTLKWTCSRTAENEEMARALLVAASGIHEVSWL